MFKFLVLLVFVTLASAQTNPKSFFAIKNVGELRNSSFHIGTNFKIKLEISQVNWTDRGARNPSTFHSHSSRSTSTPPGWFADPMAWIWWLSLTLRNNKSFSITYKTPNSPRLAFSQRDSGLAPSNSTLKIISGSAVMDQPTSWVSIKICPEAEIACLWNPIAWAEELTSIQLDADQEPVQALFVKDSNKILNDFWIKFYKFLDKFLEIGGWVWA